MVLGSAADVAHGQAHQVACNGSVGNARRGGTHQDLHLRVVLPNQAGQTLLHIGADLHVRQGQPVVTVHRAFDAGSPGKGLVRPEKDGLNLQKILGNLNG